MDARKSREGVKVSLMQIAKKCEGNGGAPNKYHAKCDVFKILGECMTMYRNMKKRVSD